MNVKIPPNANSHALNGNDDDNDNHTAITVK